MIFLMIDVTGSQEVCWVLPGVYLSDSVIATRFKLGRSRGHPLPLIGFSENIPLNLT
jgi:hypothetical protein